MNPRRRRHARARRRRRELRVYFLALHSHPRFEPPKPVWTTEMQMLLDELTRRAAIAFQIPESYLRFPTVGSEDAIRVLHGMRPRER